jgi:glucose-1-phosphate cytidylyltransferase
LTASAPSLESYSPRADAGLAENKLMKVVILAGGRGTRISEESHLRPKPMIEIGNKPILWHVMKLYSAAGINDFVICCGYRGYVIKEYFANYFLHTANVTFDMSANRMQVHAAHAEPWRVTVLDTGEATMTGGRLRRAREFLDEDEFCFTYGDGLSDVDIRGTIAFHREQRRLVTVTAVLPPGRFGALSIEDSGLAKFEEKPRGDGTWVNGGFFVASTRALDYVSGDETSWEYGPMDKLGTDGQLAAYKHRGFWQAMDTLRDKSYLEELWSSGQAPWKTWEDSGKPLQAGGKA